MKKYIIPFLLILLSVSVFAQKPHTSGELIGKWEGKDAHSEMGGIFFLKGNKAILQARGTYSPAMSYTADFKSNPIKIDLVMQAANGTRMNMKGLLQFIDHNTLKFQVFPGSERPANFDPLSTQNIVILKRSGI